MQVMRAEATTFFKPKGFSRAEVKGFSRAKDEDKDAHREAEVVDEASVVAHRSTWGGVSLISPRPKEGHSHLLNRDAGFPKDMAVIKVAQQGPQHSYHQHLLPRWSKWRTARSTTASQSSRYSRTNSSPPTAFVKCDEKTCDLECLLFM